MLKSRNWSCITYTEDFKQILAETQHYAWIYHNKDEKEPHYHVILRFKNPKTVTTVKKLLKGNSDQNVLAQPVVSLKGAYEYLLHQNEENKYKYQEEERHTDNNEFFEAETETKAVQIVLDIVNGKSYQELMQEYGRELIINYEKYEKYADKVREELLAERAKKEEQEENQLRNKTGKIKWNHLIYEGTYEEIAKEARLKLKDVEWIMQNQNKEVLKEGENENEKL